MTHLEPETPLFAFNQAPTCRIVILACIHIVSIVVTSFCMILTASTFSLPQPVRCTAPRALIIATISTETDLLIYTVLTLLNSITLWTFLVWPVCLLIESVEVIVALDHTPWPYTVGGNPLGEGSVRCRDLYLTKHNTHKRYPHPRGIRSCNSSKRATADLRLGPRNIGDWLYGLSYHVWIGICIKTTIINKTLRFKARIDEGRGRGMLCSVRNVH